MKNKIFSFDIFDTLLVRPYAKPSDLFLHLEKLENKKGFHQARINAEELARKNAFPREEITLREIYQYIPSFKEMMSKEISFEEQILSPYPQMQKFYQKLLEKKKDIIIVSDMYLPQEVIEKILKKNGYSGYKKLYLSSTYMKTKSSGSMFRYICDDLNVSSTQICHIGDNQYSDDIVPRQIGIKVCPVKKLIDQLFQYPAFYNYYNTDLTLGKSIILGLQALKPANKSYWYNVGWNFVGPVSLAFCQWIDQQVLHDQVQHIIFVGRDGYILQKVFHQISVSQCPSTYLFAPRFVQKKNIKIWNNYKEYLSQFHLPQKNVTIVDSITANFSSQKLLQEYLNQDIKGYYWTVRTEIPSNFTHQYKEFDKQKESFFLQWGLMELFLTAPYSPVIDFSNSNPVFARVNKYEKARIKAYKEMEKGCLDFIKLTFNIFGKQNLFINENEIRTLVDNIVLMPTKEDLKVLSKIRATSDIYNEEYEPLMTCWPKPPPFSRLPFIFKIKNKNNKRKYYLFGLHFYTRRIK